ncbi:MAG: protease [Bacteroidetes bacterium]|nr:MAG: protease [Bacteroidota bacterium]
MIPQTLERYKRTLTGFVLGLSISISQVIAQGFEGYYQHPDIYKNTIVFTSEGDIWKVSIEGGLAQRLTTHTEEEKYPNISPDGKTLAFYATYEGLPEVYTIPIDGGITTRWTYSNSEGAKIAGWTPKGEIIYTSTEFGSATNARLATIDVKTKSKRLIPLHQVNEAIQNEKGIWFFVTLPNMNAHIKRYAGGMARQIWKFDGQNEAVKLTTDHLGESFNPMWYENRLYFITDRDGMKNIWSMNDDGKDLKQHTFHTDFDVRSANVDDGKIVYQYGADLWLLDIVSGKNKKIDIRLVSDFEQLRETWITKTTDYITSVNPDPLGEKVVVTARGRVFVVPAQSGRTIAFAKQNDTVVRHRDAVFSYDGKNIISLSDASGEFEFVQFAADATGKVKPITQQAKTLSYTGIPSRDGKWIAYDDIDKNMYLINISTGVRKKISTNEQGVRDFSWSPDNQWLAFVQVAFTGLAQIKIYNVNDGSIFDLTNDRSNNTNVAWSPDGKFIYFLSDRGFHNLIGNPRNQRLGGVGWDKVHNVYHIALKKGTPSPFRAFDELNQDYTTLEKSTGKLVVSIDKNDIQSRTMAVPIAAGNYYNLRVNEQAIYLLANENGSDENPHLKVAEISRSKVELTSIASGIENFELTQNGKKLFIKKGQSYYMVEAGTGTLNLSNEIDLSGCQFLLNPKQEWKQLYKDAWRMERDYFYDKNMHGVDWDAMYKKYLPFVDRVTTRSELNDVLAQLIGELSVLHAFVNGGDMPNDEKHISVGGLGAITSRDAKSGGFKIDYIYKPDPDFPERKSPLADPYLDIKEGDIITKVNGVDALSVMDISELLVNQAGKQVRISIKSGALVKDIIIKPTDPYWLIYGDWQYNNRLKVEKASNNDIGYLHQSSNDNAGINQFYKEYFPAANKKGLIIDMRNNEGGYISSIMLQQLARQVWMYRIDRTGQPIERIPHLVVLVNESTGSDGEVFAEGFRRLGLGITIGKRTWGGFVALHFGNQLTDNGIAAAPMHGGYGPEGKWLVEGVGHVPDIEVDNLPLETFNGKDAQLEAAIIYLKKKIAEEPRDIPLAPVYPDKSFKNNRKN